MNLEMELTAAEIRAEAECLLNYAGHWEVGPATVIRAVAERLERIANRLEKEP